MDKLTIEELLEENEVRYRKQRFLIDKYKANLLHLSLNIPGNRKTGSDIYNLFKEAKNRIEEDYRDYKIFFREEEDKKTGYEYYVLLDGSALEIKEKAIRIEDSSEKFRLLDLDVFDRGFNQIKRGQLSYQPRKCLICQKDAKECIVNRSHTYEELLAKLEILLKG